MSTDVLRRNLSRQLDYVRTLQARGLPPVTCALARLEGEPPGAGYRPRFAPVPYREGPPFEAVMADALFHPMFGVTEPSVLSFHLGAHTGACMTLFSGLPRRSGLLEEPNRDSPVVANQSHHISEAIRTARELGQRLIPFVRALPAQLSERLGFGQVTPPTDWTEVLFHLGWHFRDHGIEAGRFRILSGPSDFPHDFRCHELDLQLGGVRFTSDVFPGVIVSWLGTRSDYLTASEYALRLLLEAVEGIECVSQPQPSAEFGGLRDTFQRLAEAYAQFPKDLDVRVLRLADSFRTPPATEWASIERGGNGWGVPKYYVLSQRNADRVVGVLRGPGLEQFLELANRAGALLPTWPARRYPAILSDVGAFARYCDPEQFPWVLHASDYWNDGMVTDHRGNVERWLGLVFGVLMGRRLEHLHLTTRPEDATLGGRVGPVNAALTLRGLNLFAASARAIELSGLALPSIVSATTPNASATPMSDTTLPVPSPELTQLLRETLRLLGEAGNNLTRFGDANGSFSEAASTWDAWRSRVAASNPYETEIALRGLIDRASSAPHRGLPDELGELWRRLMCWGAGRAATWEEFEASAHRVEWSAVSEAMRSWRERLRLLFLYLGAALPADEQPPPRTVTNPANDAPTINEAERAVLDVLRDRHPVLMKNVDIEAAAGLSKQTVGEVITGLIDKSLVARPNGERKGATVTPQGIALVDRIRKSSTDHP